LFQSRGRANVFADQHRASGLRQGWFVEETAEALDITSVVVEDAILPATEGDSDPLESESPNGGVVILSAVALLTIVSAGPVAEAPGVSRPFVKCLAEKARTGPT
jgi:hypothetical protein